MDSVRVLVQKPATKFPVVGDILEPGGGHVGPSIHQRHIAKGDQGSERLNIGHFIHGGREFLQEQAFQGAGFSRRRIDALEMHV